MTEQQRTTKCHHSEPHMIVHDHTVRYYSCAK